MESWLEDSAFWDDVAPKIRILTKETYPDARFWGVAGSSRHERSEHLTEYMEHLINLVESGPDSIVEVGTSCVDRSCRSGTRRGLHLGQIHTLRRSAAGTGGPDPARGDAQLRLRAGLRGAALRRVATRTAHQPVASASPGSRRTTSTSRLPSGPPRRQRSPPVSRARSTTPTVRAVPLRRAPARRPGATKTGAVEVTSKARPSTLAGRCSNPGTETELTRQPRPR